MKKILLTIALLASISAAPLIIRAADASTPTNAPAAATPPAPTDAQRIAGLEAYIANGDPSAAVASLKDKDGNLHKDFNMTTLGKPVPGHDE